MTVLLKSLVDQFINRYRGNLDNSILKPGMLLKYLSNDLLNAHLGKYLTMFYGVIDRKSDVLYYSIGGHFPNPILICNDKAAFIQGTGFPVGVFDKAKYTTYQMKLPDSFSMVMFSDGILEIIDEVELREKEKYLLSMVNKSSSITVDLLLDDLGLKNVQEMPDDIAFLILDKGIYNVTG